MEQALVVILLELRKTPRLSLGRFSELVFLRFGDSTLMIRMTSVLRGAGTHRGNSLGAPVLAVDDGIREHIL